MQSGSAAWMACRAASTSSALRRTGRMTLNFESEGEALKAAMPLRCLSRAPCPTCGHAMRVRSQAGASASVSRGGQGARPMVKPWFNLNHCNPSRHTWSRRQRPASVAAPAAVEERVDRTSCHTDWAATPALPRLPLRATRLLQPQALLAVAGHPAVQHSMQQAGTPATAQAGSPGG